MEAYKKKSEEPTTHEYGAIATISGDSATAAGDHHGEQQPPDEEDVVRPLLHQPPERPQPARFGEIRPRVSGRASERSLELEADDCTTRGSSRRAKTTDSSLSQQGFASVANEIVNVTKNLIGGGVLSLSGGIALYANDPRAVVSASVWIVLMGGLLGYSALLIAKVCSFTKATTYREAWSRSIGEQGALDAPNATDFGIFVVPKDKDRGYTRPVG